MLFRSPVAIFLAVLVSAAAGCDLVGTVTRHEARTEQGALASGGASTAQPPVRLSRILPSTEGRDELVGAFATPVTRATADGVLERRGPCLVLNSDGKKAALLFRSPGAAYDESRGVLSLQGAEVALGAPMFVRALRLMRSAALERTWEPPLEPACSTNAFWLIDAIGVGRPGHEELGCNGPVQAGKTFRVMHDEANVTGALETEADQALRAWRQQFGALRVCADENLTRAAGTQVDARVRIDIASSGQPKKLTFTGDRPETFASCASRALTERLRFPTAPTESTFTAHLTISLGDSDYQLQRCNRFRSLK